MKNIEELQAKVMEDYKRMKDFLNVDLYYDNRENLSEILCTELGEYTLTKKIQFCIDYYKIPKLRKTDKLPGQTFETLKPDYQKKVLNNPWKTNVSYPRRLEFYEQMIIVIKCFERSYGQRKINQEKKHVVTDIDFRHTEMLKRESERKAENMKVIRKVKGKLKKQSDAEYIESFYKTQDAIKWFNETQKKPKKK